jgi:Holliday junction resolvase
MTTARATAHGEASEKDYMQQIIDLARSTGWLVFHTFDARRSEPGFPDLVMVRGAQLVFLEVKATKTIISVEQKEWLGRLRQVRYVHADIARPADWPDVEAALKARTR